MTQAAKAQEPSMEEILASIRRIIADDDLSKTAASAPPAPVAPPRPAAVTPPPPAPEPPPIFQAPPPEPEMAQPEPVADILDLTEDMRAPAEPASFRTIDAQPDVMFSEPPVAKDEPADAHLEAARQELAASMSESLLSSRTAAAVDTAFNTLAQTVLVQNARTLEDLVREMLRPMLKSWLDDNLPGLVERLVRAEIERVSRGRSA
jgi:cell pole-organizing protein PopZ